MLAPFSHAQIVVGPAIGNLWFGDRPDLWTNHRGRNDRRLRSFSGLSQDARDR